MKFPGRTQYRHSWAWKCISPSSRVSLDCLICMGSTGSPGNKVEGWAVLTTPARKTLVGRGALTEGHQLWVPFQLLFHSIDYRCKGIVQLVPQTRFEDRDIHAALTPATSCILHTRTWRFSRNGGSGMRKGEREELVMCTSRVGTWSHYGMCGGAYLTPGWAVLWGKRAKVRYVGKLREKRPSERNCWRQRIGGEAGECSSDYTAKQKRASLLMSSLWAATGLTRWVLRRRGRWTRKPLLWTVTVNITYNYSENTREPEPILPP